jgi:FkbM family methyltransferase
MRAGLCDKRSVHMSLYQELRRVKRYLKALGSVRGLTVLAHEARTSATHEVSLRDPFLQHPVVLRTRSSDIETFGKVITEREYELQELSFASTIVDAGANIGLASIYFAAKFPNARILALEPESTNFELLTRNVAAYPNVTCLKKALWSESGTVTIFDPGDGSWGFRTARDEHSEGRVIGSVECINITDLMVEFGLDHIDLLKIDIEGSEREVFNASKDWIDRVDVVVAELHDRFKRGCSQAFFNATADFAHEVRKGENIFMFRSPTRPS